MEGLGQGIVGIRVRIWIRVRVLEERWQVSSAGALDMLERKRPHAKQSVDHTLEAHSHSYPLA